MLSPRRITMFTGLLVKTWLANTTEHMAAARGQAVDDEAKQQ